MNFRSLLAFSRLLTLSAAAALLLASCAAFEIGRPIEFSNRWESTDGKSQEQLYEDQKECRRQTSLMSSGFIGAGSGGGSWDMNDIKVFESCMRAKGWRKEKL